MGGLVGIIGGPLGILLGGSLGALLGGIDDTDNAAKDDDIFNEITENIADGSNVLLLVIRENDVRGLDDYLKTYGATTISRESIASIEGKIVHSRELEEEVKKQTKEVAKTKRQEDKQQEIDARVKKTQETFSSSEK